MKVLHIASGLPTNQMPFYQPFIKTQIESLIRAGLEIEVLDIQGYHSPLNYINSIKYVRKLIEQKNIDIIHAHYSYCGFTAYKAANSKVPIVLSLMGSDLLGSPDENGSLTLRGKFDKLLSKYVVKKVNHVIVKSEEMKSRLQLNTPISVVPNGVNFQTFQPANQIEVRNKLGFDINDFIILFLGKPSVQRKNFPLAEKASNYFSQVTGYKNVKLISPYGISQSKVVDYMNAANVLLLTSYWEGSPNVIKEAMACNLPIISTDVGDVQRIILNTQNCFLVKYSEKEISERLLILYKNGERSNGRENITYLRDDVIAKKIIEIYNKTLNRNFLSKDVFINTIN